MRSFLVVAVVVVAMVVAALVLYFGVKKYSHRNQVLRGEDLIASHDLDALSSLVRTNPSVGPSLLEKAFQRRNKECFSVLIEAGANPNDSKWNRETLLLHAIQHPDLFWTTEILNHGGDPNQEVTIINTGVPLDMALAVRGSEHALLLLSKGADPHRPDYEGYLPIETAASRAKWPVVLALLELGADYNHETHIKMSVLFNLLDDETYEYDREVMRREENKATFEAFEKVKDWFDSRKLDWRNATWDKSKGNGKSKWVIPHLQ